MKCCGTLHLLSALAESVPIDWPTNIWFEWICPWRRTALFTSRQHYSPWFEKVWASKCGLWKRWMKLTRSWDRLSRKFGLWRQRGIWSTWLCLPIMVWRWFCNTMCVWALNFRTLLPKVDSRQNLRRASHTWELSSQEEWNRGEFVERAFRIKNNVEFGLCRLSVVDVIWRRLFWVAVATLFFLGYRAIAVAITLRFSIFASNFLPSQSYR